MRSMPLQSQPAAEMSWCLHEPPCFGAGFGFGVGFGVGVDLVPLAAATIWASDGMAASSGESTGGGGAPRGCASPSKLAKACSFFPHAASAKTTHTRTEVFISLQDVKRREFAQPIA